MHSLLSTHDLYNVSSKPPIQYCAWSPTGHSLVYVKDNDIFLRHDFVTEYRLTDDGSDAIFNGVPDWIYEEEILSSNSALWWSPDSTRLAFLRFDDTLVPEYKYPLYLNGRSYPDELKQRYPKVGASSPIVSLYVYELGKDKPIPVEILDAPPDDRVITEVIWAPEGHNYLMFKMTNRIQDWSRTVLVDINDKFKAKVVREYKVPEGWIEPERWITFVPLPKQKKNEPIPPATYIDIVEVGGYNHLGLFNSLDASEPAVLLTSGEWEVVGPPLWIDTKKKLVYYLSTEKNSTERHLYSVTMDGKTRTPLTNITTSGYYDASFSRRGGYYMLDYQGPGVPYQAIVKVDGTNPYEHMLEDNHELWYALSNIALPTKRYTIVQSEDYDLNAVEVLPPDFDVRKKYPVLFRVYGGPNSQLVSHKWSLDWHAYLASNLSYIVVMVDGRGTGCKGHKFRQTVAKRLGELETVDVINAGRHWASLPYVDSEAMAIWGWSYGGYLTSKVIEANTGVFRAGIAIAPVTDWRLYNSFYTERYMKSPQMNPDGYNKSAVTNMSGFANASFLLVHGTADDNVHFQNTVLLVDRLTQARVHTYRVQFFADSNHLINTGGNTQRELYYLMTRQLWEAFGGAEGESRRNPSTSQATLLKIEGYRNRRRKREETGSWIL
ncbi:uncharacterized protein VTP21DRAFT_10550 [Calcarisporiella thermophila]|uniref:uncharacterized protein n=1 Tax=Calcarisporiella thermophila TaxID=911321 RepID=UPI003741F2BE